MKSKNIFLLIIILIVLFIIIFFYKTPIEKTNKIDPKEYEKIEMGFISNDGCSNDNYCKDKFNDGWECINENSLDKCTCVVEEENNPVCGVDDRTYKNPSEANCLGIEIDYEGECKEESSFCKKCGNRCIKVPSLTQRECNEPTEDFECVFSNGACEKKTEVGQFCWKCGNNCNTANPNLWTGNCEAEGPPTEDFECVFSNGVCEKKLGEFGLPVPLGKECSKDSDCPAGNYCKEETVCTNSLPPSCYTTSKCILRPGCGDGQCKYEQKESPETCPQDCKETLKQKTCNEIDEKISSELNKINYCSIADDCIFSGSGQLGLQSNAPALCCGIYYNKNSNLNILKGLDTNRKLESCDIFVCSCVGNKELKCINNKCTPFG